MNKKIIQDNFSKYAKFYNQYAMVQKQIACELIDFIPTTLKPVKILELGCGTGFYTELLHKKYPNTSIDAVDISSEMLKIAQRHLSNSHINWIQADIETFKNESQYDLITSSSTFQWLSDVEKTLAHLKEQLSNTGKIIFSIFGASTFQELKIALSDYFQKDIVLSSSHFSTKQTLEKMLNAQFKNVICEERTIQKTYASLKELLTHIKYTGTRGTGLIRSNNQETETKIYSKNQINQIEKIYLKLCHQLTATYQTFFVSFS